MTTVFDILSAGCLLGLIVVTWAEIRLVFRIARRAGKDDRSAHTDPERSRLVMLSSIAAGLALGFLVFGAFGDAMQLVSFGGEAR